MISFEKIQAHLVTIETLDPKLFKKIQIGGRNEKKEIK